MKPLSGLNKLVVLSLDRNQIVDLQPLADSRYLGALDLSENKISNLRPLSNLSNLNYLNLNNNKITDLQPLADLHSLVRVHLSNNKITNIEPLVTIGDLSDGMVSLGNGVGVESRYILDLENNKIRDIKALSGLRYVPDLNIKNNPIVKKVCPFVENACMF